MSNNQNQDAACFVRLFGGRCVLQCGAAPLVDSDSEDDRSESTAMQPSDMETPRGGLRAGRVERFKMVCLDTARVEIHGEATKLMKETKAATILCKIQSPTFRKQLEGFFKTKAPEAFGLCTHHRLLTQPWQKNTDQTTTTPRDESDKMPDAMMCCYRAEFACSVEDSLLCEATFMKNGKLMYVEDVSSLGDEVTNHTNTEGETGEYLGRVFRNIYETAQPFEISIETKRPMPVVACTEFNTAKALHDELARRASYFKKDGKKDKENSPTKQAAPVSTSDAPVTNNLQALFRNGVENL